MPLTGPLGFRLKAQYGLAQLSERLGTAVLGTYLLFYYSQVLGMPPALAALGAGLAVIVDAITDPVIGSISDHWRSRHGRRHPFMYAGALCTGIPFYLLFAPPVTGDAALFVWMLVWVNLARIAMTLFYIPNVALGAELTEDYHERSSVVGYRTFFGLVGGLGSLMLGFGLFFSPTPEHEHGQLNAAAYPPFALLVGAVVTAATLWSARGTRHVVEFLPQPPARERDSVWTIVVRVFTDLWSAMQSQSFRVLFCGLLALSAAMGIEAALSIHVLTFFWELEQADVLMLAPTYVLGAVVGVLLAPALVRLVSRKRMLQAGILAWSMFLVIPVVLRLAGWFPENGDPLLLPALMAFRIVQGTSAIQCDVAFGAMMADSLDEHELATGNRQEGMFFAASSIAYKAPFGIGSFVGGVALNLIDWPTGPHIRTAADIDPGTIVQLGLLVGPGIGVAALISLWCFTWYRLTRDRHARILEELANRRLAVGDSA
ncbi:MAG: MFS transporter [Gammaproteobacteria bacterium]|nr:MFS transporter [Gammaproteobacteria bacterium]MDE0364316.1 MFS transporter [Gammaproteobacteria bacterium]